jgi:hypothetical protein
MYASNKQVARFVSCDLWNDKHTVLYKAIATFLEKAWDNYLQCFYSSMHVSMVLLIVDGVSESPDVSGRIWEARGRWH